MTLRLALLVASLLVLVAGVAFAEPFACVRGGIHVDERPRSVAFTPDGMRGLRLQRA